MEKYCYKDKEIRIIKDNDQLFFIAIDICNILQNYKNVTMVMRSLADSDYKKIDFHDKGGKRNVVTEGGLLKMIMKAKYISEDEKNNILSFFKNIGYLQNIELIPSSRKEANFLSTLIKQLHVLCIDDGIRQYCIDEYFIDYYIPSINVAIEYDERDHDTYTYNQQEGREKYIREKIGCDFIRISDKDDDITNCAIVIKKLIKAGYLAA